MLAGRLSVHGDGRALLLLLGRKQNVAVGVEQSSRKPGKRGIPVTIVTVANLGCANTPSLVEADGLVSVQRSLGSLSIRDA